MYGQEDLLDSVRLLVNEYVKYVPTRTWYYYPKELPEEILSKEVRNNGIDRALSFPLEDLYPDGQPAGQVGQEIYGAEAAFSLLTRSYHHLGDAPFLFYCEYSIADIQTEEAKRLEKSDVEGMTCRARLIPKEGSVLSALQVPIQKEFGIANEPLHGIVTPEGHCEYAVPAGGRLLIRWEE